MATDCPACAPTGDGWSVCFHGFDPADEGRREALCTLGNGYQAVRGAAAAASAGGPHYPGTYAAGVYNRLVDTLGDRVVENESMVALPDWTWLRAGPDGTDVDPFGPAALLENRALLDLRHGVLTRLVRYVDAEGRRTALHERRLVHRTRRHVAATETTVVAENWSGRLRVRSRIDGAVGNTGVARYRGLAAHHLHTERVDAPRPGTVLLTTRTSRSDVRIAVAARTRVRPDSADAAVVRTGDAVGYDHVLDVPRGSAVRVDTVVTLVTSRDVAIADPATTALDLLADAPDVPALLEEQAVSWRHVWRRFRFDLAGTGVPDAPDTARDLRLGLFHVLQAVSLHALDVDAGVPARGLHGEAYRGHVFWDELFVLPVLTLRMPEVTRALLHYRVRRLDAARRAARATGRRGAMFPWQSGSDGREESQSLHLNPLSGRWLPDVSALQKHVGLAVAYNVWHYVQATGDRDFLAAHGAEVMLEVARYLAELSELDPERGRYRIRGVMGPDEFSTRYPGADRPGVDDNTYTTVMAVWLWRRARECLDLIPVRRRDELLEQLGLTDRELRSWADRTRRSYVPIRPDGVLEQFEGASALPELDWEHYRRRYGDLQRLDRILEAEGRSVDDYQVTKQADVLMLFYLLSTDELRELLHGLGYRLPADAVRRTIDHHLARTVHGSTLSSLVHAWVLARAHREDALDHFRRAVRSDLADVQGGTTAEGVHLGAMAGSVDLLQRCFAGVEVRDGALWFNPHWPRDSGRLSFEIRYRDLVVDVRVRGREVLVRAACGPGDPITVRCGATRRVLRPGGSVRLRARPGAPEGEPGRGLWPSVGGAHGPGPGGRVPTPWWRPVLEFRPWRRRPR